MQHTKSDAEAEKLGGGRVAHEVPEGCKVIRKSDEPLLGTSCTLCLSSFPSQVCTAVLSGIMQAGNVRAWREHLTKIPEQEGGPSNNLLLVITLLWLPQSATPPHPEHAPPP